MKRFPLLLAAVTLTLHTIGTASDTGVQTRSVVINGNIGEAQVLQVNGKEYIDLSALIRITRGTLSFQGNQIVLMLPSSQTGSQPEANSDPNALSQEFMKAGVEEITLLREWASPLANAIENGFPVTDHWVQGFRAKAVDGLRLASVATTSAADKRALELLRNEFTLVDSWSSKLLAAYKQMDTAKYAMSSDALRNEPDSQQILTCAHSLESMLTSGTFQDDGSCSR